MGAGGAMSLGLPPNAVYGGIFAGAWAGGYLLLRADVHRRRLRTSPLLLAVCLGALGLALATLLPASFTWHGGLAGGMIAALLLAQIHRAPALVFLDLGAAAAALALAVGLTASGLYRHNAAYLVGGLASLAIFDWLWHEGRYAVQWQRPRGIVLGEYLVLGSLAHFLTDFLRSDRDGLSASQIASLVSMAAGAVLLGVVVPRFLRGREEHRILSDVAAHGEALQPEYTPPTPECPRPELWKMYDSMTAEAEVLDFLKALVTTLKPNLVVETGTFMGVSTIAIAEGLKQNGFGRVITVEFDPKVFAKAKERIDASGLGAWVEYRNQSSLEMRVEGQIDLLFSDSDPQIRESEVRHFLPQVSANGLILIHDASSHYKVVREAALRLEREGLISVVLVPTPRGLVIAQKREGRQ